MTALAELGSAGQVTHLAERRDRELYARSLVELARRGGVPGAKLGHLAVRVLLFLLGQRPGYFAHHKVIAKAVESNLTSVRKVLFELRDAGFVSWDLIPPHHPLPTGKYTRTNVNRYFVEAEALLPALGGGETRGLPRRVASTHPDSTASTGTDPKFEQDLPLPPHERPKPPRDGHAAEEEIRFSESQGARARPGQRRAARGAPDTNPNRPPAVTPELEQVLTAWRALNLGEPDDRSLRALQNRLSEGATIEHLLAAIEGAKHDEWLQQGRARSAFAVVFASLDSIARFAAAGREHARQAEAAARRLANERRATHRQVDVPAHGQAENAGLAAQALKELLGRLAAPAR